MTFCNLPPAPPLSGGLRPLFLLICLNWKPERSSFFLCFCSLCRTERRRKFFLSVFSVGSETVPAVLVRVRSKRRIGNQRKRRKRGLGIAPRGGDSSSSLFSVNRREISASWVRSTLRLASPAQLRADRVRSKTPPYPPRSNEKKFSCARSLKRARRAQSTAFLGVREDVCELPGVAVA
jgi:hypothetical protein